MCVAYLSPFCPCRCDFGFTGKACDRKGCPNDCNGKGICLNLKHYAETKDPGEGQVYKYTENWDREMIQGCMCDPGFYGPECLLKSCQHGDDPLTTGQFNELQTVSCTATGGTFALRFRGRQTRPLAHDSTADEVRLALEGLGGGNVLVGSVLYRAKVTILTGGATACSATGST